MLKRRGQFEDVEEGGFRENKEISKQHHEEKEEVIKEHKINVNKIVIVLFFIGLFYFLFSKYAVVEQMNGSEAAVESSSGSQQSPPQLQFQLQQEEQLKQLQKQQEEIKQQLLNKQQEIQRQDEENKRKQEELQRELEYEAHQRKQEIQEAKAIAAAKAAQEAAAREAAKEAEEAQLQIHSPEINPTSEPVTMGLDSIHNNVIEAIERLREFKKAGRVIETDTEAQIFIPQAQSFIRSFLTLKYGQGPYYIAMNLEFPSSMTTHLYPSTEVLIVELAPIEEVPYSVYFFLEYIVTQFKIGKFHRNAGHVLQAMLQDQQPIQTFAWQEYSQITLIRNLL